MLGALSTREIISLGAGLGLLWLGLWLASRAIRRLARRLGDENRERMEEIEGWAKQLIRFLRATVAVLTAAAAVFIILRDLGVTGVPRLSAETVTTWLAVHGLRIVLVVGGTYVLIKVLHLLIYRVRILVSREGPLVEVAEQQKRAQTLGRMLRRLVTVIFSTLAGLIVLREVGVDITPILTGGAIGGLAVGFGAQHLVRDVISGFFLILEDQVRVGDVALINGRGGLVEAINLRTTVLRDFDGRVHVIPNGAITELSNLTKDYSYYVIDLGVAYKENVDRVMQTLKEVGAELEKDPAYGEKILAPLEVVGVDAFGDSAVILKMRIKTVPREQWSVGRELRRRIKNTFDARGIEIPYPHLSVYFGEASKPFAVEVTEQLARRESR